MRVAWFALVLLTACAGCIEIDGGAVEARWELQYGGPDCPAGADQPTCRLGTRIDCEEAELSAVQLVLEPRNGDADPCAGVGDCRFSCARLVGTTPFFVPAGDYVMSLQVVDLAGNPLTAADGVTAPPPVVRRVRAAELTNLNVNLIIVARCAGCP